MLLITSQTLAYIYHAYYHITNPNIHISYLSSHLIRASKQTFIDEAASIFDRNLGISKFKQTYDIIKTFKAYHSTKHTYTHYKVNPYACSYECKTYLTYCAASQHLWHQCMIMWMYVHRIKARNKRNPNLAY